MYNCIFAFMKYDKHHIDKILKALENGDGRVRAVAAAGLHYSTLLDWLDKYSDFSEAVKKAEDTGNDKIKDICKRRIIDDKTWQSAAWWLERNYPDEYKDRKFLEHAGKIGNFKVEPIEWVGDEDEDEDT
jgi:hypothetical protein